MWWSVRLEDPEYLLTYSFSSFFDLVPPIVVAVVDIQLEFKMLQIPSHRDEPQERAREATFYYVG